MRVFTDPNGAVAGGPSAFQRPIPCRGHQCRGRLQPLARPGRDALARGRHPRLLGSFCYLRDLDSGTSGRPPGSRRSSRPNDTRRYSRSPAPSSAAATTHRHAHRNQRIARGRHRAAADHDHQPIRMSRTIEVTSYAEVVLAAPAARSVSPRVQQPVRANRTRARSAGDHLYPPSAVGGGKAAVDDASDDGPGHDRRRGVVRNRSDEIHRSGRTLRSGRHGRQSAALRQRGAGARSRDLHSPGRLLAAERDRRKSTW